MNMQYNGKGKIVFKLIVFISALILLGVAFYGTYQWQQNRVGGLQSQVDQLKGQLNEAEQKDSTPKEPVVSNTYTSAKGTKVMVYVPSQGDKVTSPVAVIGEVPGNWSFEASFPVVIKNSEGVVVAQGAAEVIGDWMTEELVPFSATLTYTSAVNGNGNLVLEKNNPSGLDKNDDSVTIPIKF